MGGFGLGAKWQVSRVSDAFGFPRRLRDRLRLGDFGFKCADRFPQQGDRPLLALGKILARFLNLRFAPSWSVNGTHDRAGQRGSCNEGAAVERRGEVIPHVCGRAVPKCRRQGFVDGRFEREDFGDAHSPLHILGIKSLQALHALLQPLDTTPLLSDGQNRRFGLGRRNRTTGHEGSRISM
jgi:hypothetical protein